MGTKDTMMSKEPCIDCSNKQVDKYGYLCDLSCGKRTAWLNYRAGIKEVVEFCSNTHLLISNHDYRVVGSVRQEDEHSEDCRLCKLQTKLKDWGLSTSRPEKREADGTGTENISDS